MRIIGEKLGVTNILEGSVRKSGNTVRVTAQLISTNDGAHLWSDTFDRDLDDIFKVQDEIARSVVNTLKVKLLGEALPKRQAPKVSEAYDLYLRGRYFQRQLGRSNFAKATDYYQQALTLDPELALAWGGLATVYTNQTMNGALPPDRGKYLADEALDQAIALDPMLVEGIYHRAFTELAFNWNWLGAEAAAKRTLAIEPNHSGALSLLGLLTIALGRAEEAVDYQQRSLQADPLRIASYHNLGFIYYQDGQYSQANAAFREVRFWIFGILGSQGRTDFMRSQGRYYE